MEKAARAVLAARAPHFPPHGTGTLADLYDPLTMPAALAKAHPELDRTVERCYRAEFFHSDRERSSTSSAATSSSPPRSSP